MLCIEKWQEHSFSSLPLFVTNLGVVDGEVQFVPTLDLFAKSLEESVLTMVGAGGEVFGCGVWKYGGWGCGCIGR